MALLSEVIEGLQIFMRHGDGHNVDADHDVIYARRDEDLTEEELKRLKALGWHYSDDPGSWACFV